MRKRWLPGYERLKHKRKALRWTQIEAADKLSRYMGQRVEQYQISRMETGRVPQDIEIAEAYIELLNQTLMRCGIAWKKRARFQPVYEPAHVPEPLTGDDEAPETG